MMEEVIGADYQELPEAYVIFICDYDPFGKGNRRWEERFMVLQEMLKEEIMQFLKTEE